MVCIHDMDCPASFVCYTNTSWFVSAGSDGCQCSTWYGFTGPDCSPLNTPASKWWLASSILLAFISFLLAGIATANLVKLHRAGKFSLLRDATSTATVQLLVGLLFSATSQVMTAFETQDPRYSTQSATPTSDKIATLKIPRESMAILGVCGTIIAALTTALVWVEIAERAHRLAGNIQQDVIPKTRRAVVAFEVMLVVGMLSACIASAVYIAVIMGLVGELAIVLLYLTGFWRMKYELNRFSALNGDDLREMYRKVMSEIACTASGVLIGVILVLIMCVVILYLSMLNWKEICLPGEIPPIIIMWQLLPVAILVVQSFVLNALRTASSRKVMTSKSRTSEHSGTGAAKVAASDKHPQKTDTAVESAGVFSSEPKSPSRSSLNKVVVASPQSQSDTL